MADFCITAVRYSDSGDHITYVKVCEEREGTIGPSRTVPRAFVADLIRLKKAKFITRTKNLTGKWARGAEVHVIDDIYLTTQRNDTKRDNLGSLPEF